MTARGSLFRINLGATSPPEFGKTRPGLIVSGTVRNEVLDSVGIARAAVPRRRPRPPIVV